MENKKFIEAGKIVNTHGINGEVKIQPWCDSAEFLCGFDCLYINETPFKVQSASVHKNCVIARLEGVAAVGMAMALKNSIVCIQRADVQLGEGEYFIADIIGLPVYDEESGAQIGTLSEVLEYPASKIYVVSGSPERLIPAVPEFIRKVDTVNRAIYVRLIEGM